MLRTSNPVLRDDTFAGQRWGGIMNDLDKHESGSSSPAMPGVMSIRGTAIKTGFLVLLCAACAVVMYTLIRNGTIGRTLPFWGGMIGSIGLGFVIAFWKQGAPFLAPVYAVVKGVFLGVLTLMIADQIPVPKGLGANEAAAFAAKNTAMIFNAVGLTFGIAIALAGAYAFGLIRIGSTMMKVVTVATVGVGLLYLAQFVMSMMGVPFLMQIHQGGTIGIVFSLFVIALASFNLVMTFQFAEDGVKSGAPKYLEWYMGFAILVELAWLYIEILRLLAKLRRD
jgi:uncharacterized YccA/Bax inhibitor family protein